MRHRGRKPDPAAVCEVIDHDRREELTKEHQRRQCAENALMEFIRAEFTGKCHGGGRSRQLRVCRSQASGDNNGAPGGR